MGKLFSRTLLGLLFTLFDGLTLSFICPSGYAIALRGPPFFVGNYVNTVSFIPISCHDFSFLL